MINPNAEMLRAGACAIADADLAENDGTPEEYAAACIMAVLPILARDYCLKPRNHVFHPLVEQTAKTKWVCPKCGGPLSRCETCREPSLCGDAWCSNHVPDGAP